MYKNNDYNQISIDMLHEIKQWLLITVIRNYNKNELFTILSKK